MIIIIIVFLGICCLIFYNTFYPDGIPEHLKQDKESEKSEKDPMEEEKEPMMMDEASPDANGNGTQLENKMEWPSI